MWLSIIPEISGFNTTIVLVLLILGIILALIAYFTGELTAGMVIVLGFTIYFAREGFIYGWVFWLIAMIVSFWIGFKLIGYMLSSNSNSNSGGDIT